jgi:septation ring formation regulator EzrA
MEAIIIEILSRYGVPGLFCVVVFLLLKRLVELEKQKIKARIDERFSEANARLDHHDKQLERGNSRFSAMENTLNEIRVGIGKIEAAMEFVKERVK